VATLEPRRQRPARGYLGQHPLDVAVLWVPNDAEQLNDAWVLHAAEDARLADQLSHGALEFWRAAMSSI
jgi:hypothetical protein